MNAYETQKEYFVKYILNVRKLSKSSAYHYLEGIKKDSEILVEKNLIRNTLFEVQTIDELNNLFEILNKDNYFAKLNSRGHNMYSCAFKRLLEFANGIDFEKIQNPAELLDIPVEAPTQLVVRSKVWNRSNIKRVHTLNMANYKCEIDGDHKTFIAKSNNKAYMEGHHAIPLNKQESFDVSLDVYANVVCLCPICHRQIHYGLDCDKTMLMNKIYDKRADWLDKSGIRLSKDEFARMA